MDDNPLQQKLETPRPLRVLFLLSILAIVLAGFLSYLNSFDGEFVFDDTVCIKNNKTKSPEALWQHFKDNFMFRSVVYASYNLDYQLSPKIGGEYNVPPEQFHRTNFFIHLLASIGVLFLVYLLVSELEEGTAGRRKGLLAGTLAGLIFVVHPLNTEGVSYIAGRSASLSSMFYVWGICWFAWAVRRVSQLTALRRASHLAGAFFIFLLAFCTRESSISWPLVALAWITFVSFKNKNWMATITNRRLLLFLGIGLITIGLLTAYRLKTERLQGFNAAGERKAAGTAPVAQLHDDKAASQSQSSPLGLKFDQLLDTFFPKGDRHTPEYEFGRLQQLYVYTQTYAINFWSKFFFPIGQCADSTFMPKTGVFSANFILGAGVMLIMLAGVFLLKQRRPAVAFFYFWLLFSSIVFAFGKWENDPLAERKAYLIGVAWSGLAGYYLMEIMTLSRRLFYAGVAAVLIIVAALGALTHERNHIWNSGVTLWEDVLRNAPRNSRAKINLGEALSRLATFGENDEAASDRNLTMLFDVYRTSKFLRPETISRLGRELDRRDRRSEAISILEKAIRDYGNSPGMDEVYFALGEIYFSMEKTFEERRNKDRLGRTYLEKALTLNYRNDSARRLLSDYYHMFSSDENAREYEGIVSPEDRIKYLETGIGYFKYMERAYAGPYDDVLRQFAPKFIANMEEKLAELKKASSKP